VIFITVPSFQSDDSLYVYAAYAISRGVTPYSQIFLAHPPMLYFVFAAVIEMIGVNLILTRLFSIGIFLATFFLSYLMAKALFKDNKKSEITALLCTSIYAFYPIIVVFSIPVLAEFTFTFFTLTSVVFYAKSTYSGSKLLLFFAGLFMGLALITKLTAFIFIASIILFNAILVMWRRKYRKVLTDTFIISLGIAVPLVATLFLMHFYFNSLSEFYIQTYSFQTIRRQMIDTERWSSISAYLNSFFPLIVTGVLGALYLLIDARKWENPLIVLPAWIYASNAVVLIFLPTVFLHYFFYLTPYLSFLSLIFFIQVLSLICNRRKSEIKVEISSKLKKKIFPLFLSFILLIALQVVTQFGTQFSYFYGSPYTKVELYIGNYVKNITNFDDKIWTSEGGIAFFAQRIIVAPNSSEWPMQCLFNDVFNNTFNDGRKGMGILSPEQFIEAWEKEKVKVIIFILGTGWVPYPDDLLWNGFQNQDGVAHYVEEKYELRHIVTASEVPYVYEIWVRK
jgi:4-amino-4-deoxy-L-arabinose transferase-like glycosyltransferase